MRLTAIAMTYLSVAIGIGWCQQSQTIDHADSQQTGSTTSRLAWQSAETILTPANVAGGGFQLLFTCTMDTAPGSQALYLTGVTVGGVTHNAAYIASAGNGTSGNIAYLFDVSTSAGCQTLWSTQLGNGNGAGSLGNGCLGTGAYDASNGWIFQVCKDSSEALTLYKINASTGAVLSSVAITFSTTGIGDQTGGLNGVASAAQTGTATGTTNGTYTGIALNGANGTGATATIVVNNNIVTSATISAAGSRYAAGETFTVNVSAAGGSGLQLLVTTGNVTGTAGPKDTVTAGSYPFLPAFHRSRPGLTLTNGNVIIDLGSSPNGGDIHPWHGAVLAYSESSLTRVYVTNLSPNGYGAALWASSRGNVVDANGNQYLVTGNGDNPIGEGLSNGCNYPTSTANCDFGDAIVEISPTGAVIGAYMPPNSSALEAKDSDAAANGLVGLPNASGVMSYIAYVGKDAVLRTLPMSCLSTFNCSPQAFAVFTGNGDNGSGCRSMAFANNVLYLSSWIGAIYAYAWTPSTGLFNTTPVAVLSAATTGWKYPGAIMSVSSNGANNEILWASTVRLSLGQGVAVPGYLTALNPTTLATLWTSSDTHYAVKFIPPTPIGGGQILLPIGGTSASGPVGVAGLNVYGLAASLSVTKTHSGNFSQGQNGAQYTVTVSNGSGAGPTIGTVTVTETVPAGVTLASMSGTGWTCPLNGNTCTRGDQLAAGASYPQITVTVNVAGNAGSQVTNQVSVSGGGSATANGSDPTTVIGPATQLVFSTPPPSTGTAGSPFGLAVQVEDMNGNLVTGSSASVTVGSSPSGVGGTLTVSATNGVATFSNLVFTGAGGYTLSATSNGLTSTGGASITIGAGSANKLVFSTPPPSTGTAGSPFGLVVQVEDMNGNLVTGSSASVTVGSSPSGVGGTVTVSATNGVATFTNLAFTAAGGYTLSATSNGLTSTSGASITIGAGSANKLVFSTPPPSTGTAGSPFGLAVQVEDMNGNLVTSSSASVTVGSSPSGVGGTLTVSATNGVATFTNLVFTAAGGYTLSATSNGLTSTGGASITIGAGSANKLVFSTPPPSTGTAGSPFGLVVQVEDMNGNLVASSSASVTVGSSPSGVGGTVTVSATNGVATFSNLVFTAAGGYTLSATSNGLTSTSGASITIAPNSALISFATSPTGLLVSVDGGAAQATPFALTLTVGSHAIAVAATQAGTTGTQYVFTGWSDSGAATHTITVGTSPATYTAAFQTQYQLTTAASPSAGGSVTPATGAFYNAGTPVSVQASSNAGYQFANFSGGALAGAVNPQSVTMNAPGNVVANFTPLAPSLAATVGTRTVSGPNVLVNFTLTNTGLGTATNATITSITAITDVAGSGAVTVASGTPLNLGTISPKGAATGTITFNWPSTATRVSFTVNYTADGGYKGSATLATLY